MTFLKALGVLLITGLMFSVYPPFTLAQEICEDGVSHATMATGDTLAMCWGVHQDPAVAEYEIYMRQEGEQYDFQGDHTILTNAECNNGECNAPLNVVPLGDYYFVYIATDGAFLRSAPSNEVRLTVRVPLPEGPGCSITR